MDVGLPPDAEPWWQADPDSPLLEAPTPEQWDRLDPDARRGAVDPAHDTLAEDVATDLAVAALYRQSMGVLEPTDAQIQRMLDRAAAWDHAVADQTRLTHINAMAMDFYADRVDTRWAGTYLDDRLPGWRSSPHVTAGYAPAAWTALVDHLGGRGVTDDELLETGLATRARTGRLIDRFRDRVVLPITHEHQILGFVARRHPDLADDDRCGPKYLNTSDTVLFHKGAQLHGVIPELLQRGAVPVLVEGPIDALAVTLAGQDRYVGVAPLGTALTDEQARQLATLSTRPIVATDADLPGRIAAERAFWLLAQHGADPRAAELPEGSDPASILHTHGPEALAELLDKARPLGRILIDKRLANLTGQEAVVAATRVIAARPASTWATETTAVAARAGANLETVSEHLRAAVTAWNRDPARAAADQIIGIAQVTARLDKHHVDHPHRWVVLADQIDPRLTTQRRLARPRRDAPDRTRRGSRRPEPHPQIGRRVAARADAGAGPSLPTRHSTAGSDDARQDRHGQDRIRRNPRSPRQFPALACGRGPIEPQGTRPIVHHRPLLKGCSWKGHLCPARGNSKQVHRRSDHPYSIAAAGSRPRTPYPPRLLWLTTSRFTSLRGISWRSERSPFWPTILTVERDRISRP